MNKAKLKSYTPSARRDFIQAVTDRASFFGISEKQIVPVEVSGDIAIIGGRPFPRAVAEQRRKLDARISRDGFTQVMEAVAYTWFNRFLALRYMELHGYLEHGYRVLSNSGGSNVPELLEQATNVDLPGLNKQKVVELKLDGSKDAELYRLLLVAQCNALNSTMPFLFERIEDETELLLPDNLLHSDSLIRKLVTEIEEQDWEEVEIIGWLYQFYISEKKDQVIGKVVKSEDIPAATQLFTPNWIVKYMVQNSLGRQWIATYPDSPIKAKMEYYIEPTEQTEDVKKQLIEITPDSLDPEKLTLLDPASGSGHILVEAYDVFKEIYLERGYSNRDFPRLILEKNLYGLDIDDRAAQMAGFALLMKARKDDRRILRSENPVKLNVLAFQESGSITVNNAHWNESANSIRDLVDLFKYGKTFGSLIQVPKALAVKLASIENVVSLALTNSDLYVSNSAKEIMNFVELAKLLTDKFDCVVANPPYMGGKYLTPKLKEYLNENYKGYEKDLFSAFVIQDINLCKNSGQLGFMSPFVWMFISSYEELRKHLINRTNITSLVQLEYSGFEGATVPICTYVLCKSHINGFKSSFVRLADFRGSEQQGPKTLEAIQNQKCGWFYNAVPDDFSKIPGSPIAYWVGDKFRNIFKNAKNIGSETISDGQTKTGDNSKYLRLVWEVSESKIGKGNKWLFHPKGGEFRKWYGNLEWLIDWSNQAREHYRKDFVARILPEYLWGKKGFCWTLITSAENSFRIVGEDELFNLAAPTLFPKNEELLYPMLAFLNTNLTEKILKVINPTLNTNVGEVQSLPFLYENTQLIIRATDLCKECIDIAKMDWDSFETSIGFKVFPLLSNLVKASNIHTSFQNWEIHSASIIARMQALETENNRMFIEAYGLQDELSPDVPSKQITLTNSDREADIKRLISYAIGCIMGRYCLNQPGLVYAKSGNDDFEPSSYKSFPADDDGIVPVMDMEWFPDDAASRFEEFLKVAWSPETLEENLKFVADSLSPKGGETPRETIRRYVSTQFYKDHMQTYKKRPIYWLFSSGKQRAFECLVYLHRYNESTLSRMRNEYVIPLQGKFSAQADYLSNEVNAVSSTADRNRLQKQLDTLRKKQTELASFDDLLRHYADQRIGLDLDEGVKTNYGKFGALLAEVKTIIGGVE